MDSTSTCLSVFRRALAVARQQPAKSWELRAAFDTRDLKEANELLDTLAS
jgi:hypothetical protein